MISIIHIVKDKHKRKFMKLKSQINITIIFVCLFVCCFKLFSQDNVPFTKNDLKALKNVIIEKYYIATDEDIKDTIGGKLAEGSITYRIFIELKKGYTLSAVYGTTSHPLFIETSTCFFNDTLLGSKTPDLISDKDINEHNIALDSWVSMGATTIFHNGITKKEDKDGALLKNKAQLSNADGYEFGDTFKTLYFGDNLKFFHDSINAKRFYADNFAWSNLLGAEGVTPKNRILIAQLTTNGILSFELNIQVKTPEGNIIRFVSSKPEKTLEVNQTIPFVEVQNRKLSFNK